MMYLYQLILFGLFFQTCQIDPCQNKDDVFSGYNQLIEEARQLTEVKEDADWTPLDKRKKDLQTCLKNFENDLTLEEQSELLGLNMQYNGLKLSNGIKGQLGTFLHDLNFDEEFNSDQIGNLMEGYISKFLESDEFKNLDKEDIDIKINGFELDGDDIKNYMELLEQKSGDDIKSAMESLGEALEEITKDLEQKSEKETRKKL